MKFSSLIKIAPLLVFVLMWSNNVFSQYSSGINNIAPSSKAALDINNDGTFPQGLLIPRLKQGDSLALQTGIKSSESGLMFYDVDNNVIRYWNGSGWNNLGGGGSTSASASLWNKSANKNYIYPTLTADKVGIGINIDPLTKLQVVDLANPRILTLTGSNGTMVFSNETDANTLFSRSPDGSTARDLFLIASLSDNKGIAIAATGNIGIGIKFPSELLHVKDGAFLLDGESASPTATPAAGALFFKGTMGGSAILTEAGSNDMVFWKNNGASWLEMARFTSNGGFSAGFPGAGAYGFNVDKYGNLAKINNVNYSWPISNGSGVLTNSGTGTLSWTPASDLTGVGSANTVPYWTSTKALGFTNLRYNGAGNFGLGIAPSTSLLQLDFNSNAAALLVKNAGIGDAFFTQSTNASGTALYASSAATGYSGIFMGGNVGIGTASPRFNLTLNGNAGNTDIQLVNNISGTLGNDGLRINFSGVDVNMINYETGNFNLGTGVANVVTMTSAGRLGIKILPTTNTLEVGGNASKAVPGPFIANSDSRLKKNINTIQNGIGTIMKLRPVSFHYNDIYKEKFSYIKDHDFEYYNFIAQEFMEVFPNSVQLDNGGYYQVDIHNVTPFMVKAFQEQQIIIENLQKSIQNQDLQLQQLKGELYNKEKQLLDQKLIFEGYEKDLQIIKQQLGIEVMKH